ncbi:acylphosphatase [Anaerosalibacter massiliensis]|uniref:Acylphosphatase n=1 Tax=Anaerosalibacter massiliensis TaxID=1347392 RepID=A0A9X2MPG3_9FIRM|nr:acylphosphatase [Anaerosalibacter massiliensis]MCR2044736.1 acylphosphatase [Anaerosalibacter massiliensis]
MIRKILTINGEVSEGGIRYHAQMQSSLFNLTGFAKKGSDNTVIIEVQGEEESINKFIKNIRKGNGFYKVSSIEEENTQVVEGEKIFAIK